MSQKEKVIIDMRKSSKEDLFVLAIFLSKLISNPQIKIQVKKPNKNPLQFNFN